MTPDLVLFDCDGVLVDTEGPVAEVMAANLTRHGLAITPERVRDLFQGGTMKGAGEAARALGASLPDDWESEIYGEAYARLEEGVPLLPGVVELLDTLDARGIAHRVVSNGPLRKMEISLGPSGLYERLGATILSGHETGLPKPDPGMLTLAMREAQVPAERTVMVDDSPAGCIAARRAGVACYGFAPEGQGMALAKEGATVVRSMPELQSLLLGGGREESAAAG